MIYFVALTVQKPPHYLILMNPGFLCKPLPLKSGHTMCTIHAYVGLDFFRLSEVMIHGTVSVGQESITAGLQLEVVR